MKMSESIDQLATALAKAQATIETAAKDSINPHFKSQYADLLSVWRAANPALVQNDLAVSQLCEPSEDGAVVSVTTILMHKSGQWMSGTVTMRPSKPDPQGIGSAITYARRYSLAALVGVCPEDDDGNAASGRQEPSRRPVAKPTADVPNVRDLIVASVKAWTGVQDDDVVAMVGEVKKAMGIKTAKMTADEQNKVLAWVRDQIDRKTKFEEVLK